MTESMPNISRVSSNIPRNWLILISFCALLIRLIAAYIQPPFLDEGYVFFTTKASLPQLINELKIDAHPPTYNLLIYPLVRITSSIFLLRLPQVLLSLPALWLVYHITKRFNSEKTALTVTWIYALNHSVWITDAQLRSYGPLSFCLLLVWLGMLDMRRGDSPLASILPHRPRLGWMIFTLAGTAAASLHILGCLALGAAIIFSLYLTPNMRKNALISLFTSITPCCIWFLWSRLTPHFAGESLIGEQKLMHSAWHGFLASPLNILGCWDFASFHSLLSDIDAVQPYTKYILFIFILANIIITLLFFSGWHTFAKEQPWEAHFLGISVMLPFFVLLIGDKLSFLFFQPRYMTPFAVPFLLLIIQAKNNLRHWLLNAVLIVNALNCLLFPLCPFMWNQNWQPTFEFIQSTQQPNDTIAITDPYSIYGFAYAYDPDNIKFIFQDSQYSNVAIDQRTVPGKLRVIPLDAYMMNSHMLDWLGDGQLYLVICQATRTFPDLLTALEQHYTVVDYQKTPSMVSWSSTVVLHMKKKKTEKQNVH